MMRIIALWMMLISIATAQQISEPGNIISTGVVRDSAVTPFAAMNVAEEDDLQWSLLGSTVFLDGADVYGTNLGLHGSNWELSARYLNIRPDAQGISSLNQFRVRSKFNRAFGEKTAGALILDYIDLEDTSDTITLTASLDHALTQTLTATLNLIYSDRDNDGGGSTNDGYAAVGLTYFPNAKFGLSVDYTDDSDFGDDDQSLTFIFPSIHQTHNQGNWTAFAGYANNDDAFYLSVSYRQ